MANKIKNLTTGLTGLVLVSGLSLIICFCLISLVNASDEGLVAYYSFDEGEGNVLHDLSGNGNDGTIYGAKWVDGKYGKALSFDGRDDYVEIPDDNSLDLTTMSVGCWFKSGPNVNNYRSMVSKELSSGYTIIWPYRLMILKNTGKVRFDFTMNHRTKDGYIETNNVYNDDRWHYVTVSRDDNIKELKIYIDGKLDNSKYYSGNIDQNNEVAKLGISPYTEQNTYGSYPFDGIIDEVRIYNRALTESEIKADMVSSSPEMMKKTIQNTISKTQTKIDQLKKENINTETIEKIITSAESALQKEAYKTALEQAQDASSKADKIWNAFQSYNSIKKEVDAKVDQLKRENIDTSIIEKSLSEAKSAFENENFELAQQLVSDASSKADKMWNVYQYIKNAKDAVKEAKAINCDASKVESKINDATDALNKGSSDIAKNYAYDAISLAKKANCGRINIKDLKALAVKYDGRTVEISGKVRDIETVYGRGYKFIVDDGMGLIVVGYEGSMKDIDDGNSVVVEGVFSRSSDAILAEKVENAGVIGGGGILLWAIIGIVIIGIIAAGLFILKKGKGGEKRKTSIGEKI